MSIAEAMGVNDEFETLSVWFSCCEQREKLFLCILLMLETYNTVVREECATV